MEKIKFGSEAKDPNLKIENTKGKLLDLSFLDVLEELGPEHGEIRKLSEKSAGKKIILEIAEIINGNDMYKRADLRRELRDLPGYKRGAIVALVNMDTSLDEVTKNKILDLVEV